jgi:hypothetical protein
MTTYADALEVMLTVQACHPRTAPRQDDDDVTNAMANVWAELFTAYNLDLPDLQAAVKRRAIKEPGAPAPEPGEIVKYAREIRNERAARDQADPDKRALHEAAIDSKVAQLVAPLATSFSDMDRPALPRLTANRSGKVDPTKLAEARAELDAIRECGA